MYFAKLDDQKYFQKNPDTFKCGHKQWFSWNDIEKVNLDDQ